MGHAAVTKAEKRRKAAKAGNPRGPMYEHLEDGSVWRLVKGRPVVLQSPFTGESRQPSEITFRRDYKALDRRAGQV